MKKLLSTLLTSLGIASSAQAAPPVVTVDPKTIRFTMPTVAADEIEFVMPTKETFTDAPQFHEDEWCQLEFYPANRLQEVKRLLTEFKAFELRHRTQYGWNEIYARRIARSTIVAGGDAIASVRNAVSAKQLPSPILTTTSNPLGQVKGGFSLSLPGSVLIYGLSSPVGISALGASVSRGGNDSQLTTAFVALNKSNRLILIDWRSQMILVSVASTGEVDVWRP